jgi:putative FmdB family regulatory protein
MPIYEYQAADTTLCCDKCRPGFDILQRISEPTLTSCPDCGNPVIKLISAPSVGGSKSDLDSRAKASGFTKLKRLGKGEYEKQY